MTINFNKAEFVLSATTQNAFIRDGRPQVTFAGRSNVGKSSVINRLLNRKNLARVGATPGKTSQVNYFRIDGKLYFTDLPGYGYAKVSKEERDRWGRLMESYFQEPGLISLGVLIVDARHKPSADDVTMCDWFKEAGCPMLVVANKVDKLKKAGSRAKSGGHPPDAGASPRHAAGPLLRREGRRQDGGAVPAEPVLRLSIFPYPPALPGRGDIRTRPRGVLPGGIVPVREWLPGRREIFIKYCMKRLYFFQTVIQSDGMRLPPAGRRPL